MADVSISNLNLGVPAGNDVIPYSTSSGSATNKTLVSSITAGIPVYVAKQLFSGTTAERPSPATAGAIRFNTSTGKAEIYNGTNWGSILSDFGPYTLEVLIVAGGGGGGGRGGGGGGGVIPFFNFTANSFTSYTATVGAGGAGGQNNGANSAFNSTYTAIGGGGGSSGLGAGSVGGSGGGGGELNCGGAGTAGQGNAGGCGRSGGHPYAGGAGGGYGGAGGNYGGVGGTGLALDVNIKQVLPFSNLNGVVVTHMGSGGGWSSSTAGTGAGGPGAGGSGTGQTAAAKWYGCGGCNGGAGFKGAIVIRYAGTQRGAGGDNVTYNAADNKTYHVFTTVGTSTFSTN